MTVYTVVAFDKTGHMLVRSFSTYELAKQFEKLAIELLWHNITIHTCYIDEPIL